MDKSIRRICSVTLIVLLPFSSISTICTADYSHNINDSEGDITLETYTESIENVERPNIDIIFVNITESNGIVNLSLSVKGKIISASDISYLIRLTDTDQWNGVVSFNDGICKVEWSNYLQDNWKESILEVKGINTTTLSVNFSLEDVGTPVNLQISQAETREYFMDEFNNFESYSDSITSISDEMQNNDAQNEAPGFTILLIGLAGVIIISILKRKK